MIFYRCFSLIDILLSVTYLKKKSPVINYSEGLAYFHSAWKVTAVPSQKRPNRISRLTHWRALHRPTVAGRTRHMGSRLRSWRRGRGGPCSRIPFRGSGPARAAACENAQSTDLRRQRDPVGAPDDDESIRLGPSRTATKLSKQADCSNPRLAISLIESKIGPRELPPGACEYEIKDSARDSWKREIY